MGEQSSVDAPKQADGQGGGLQEAGPAHAGVLAAIHAAAFPPPEAWSETVLAGLLAQPGCFGLLHPAGGMVLARTAGDEAEILTLAVAPTARRRGIGAALLGATRDRAAARGATALFLEVAADNAPARALYASAGFVPVGKRAGYYADGGDAIVLRADLSRPGAAAGG
jgi:ribosomal-protein-alanine N-acetyltransferase